MRFLRIKQFDMHIAAFAYQPYYWFSMFPFYGAFDDFFKYSSV